MDNLSAHFGADIDGLFANFGHYYVARPIHSPDFGFVEWSFNWIRMYLQRNWAQINEQNLEEWIHRACDDLQPHHVESFARDAHYYVAGQDYHPYL